MFKTSVNDLTRSSIVRATYSFPPKYLAIDSKFFLSASWPNAIELNLILSSFPFNALMLSKTY